LQALKNWPFKIDIIIAAFGYHGAGNLPFNESSKHEDDYFMQMQAFFDQLSGIAGEMVFISDVQMDWPVEPLLQLMFQKMYFNGGTDLFEMDTKVSSRRSQIASI
jgi:hypothetical protein